MLGQINEAQEGRTVSIVDMAAPGDVAPPRTEITATGQRGIPVLISPFQIQSEGRASGAATAPEMMSTAFQGFLLLQEEKGKGEEDPAMLRKKWFNEMRGWLMVLATVAASVTYQAGLNPPGGFWQDSKGHVDGNPVLRDMRWSRYMVFYYFNATAFVTSLVIMMLLMSERFYYTEAKVMALMLITIIDLASLIGAYIAGTTHHFSSCIYIIAIVCVAFVCIIYIGEVMADICMFLLIKFPCMLNLAQRKWCPMPSEVVKRATKLQQQKKQWEHQKQTDMEERRSQARMAMGKQRGTCCPCCAPRTEV
ncbi:hypothetical protein EJB05_12767, partial [Eragrostis curvula]